MIERNAILINGGSAADVDRASTAAAAVGGLVSVLQMPSARRYSPGSRGIAVRIPATMPLASAADVRGSDALAAALLARSPGGRVAIIGFGGLGDMGVQVAAAMARAPRVINHMEQQMDDASRFARGRKGRPT
jgi:hypothetical protein